MLDRGAFAVMLCAAVSCSAPAGPAHPASLAGHIAHYAPLGMKDDAKQPGQAVILGTDDADGSTVLPLPATTRTVVVDAMIVTRGAAAPVRGDTLAITLTAAPAAPTAPAAPAAPAANVRGVLENLDLPGAARWNAGLWSAALVAATTLGKDLPDVVFSATPAGPADGVAASALITAGFLAAMTGAPIDPAATLAGAIHPDGTIGAVAGLPEQFLGALAHGKTRLGFPSGMRLATSEVTGNVVDLVVLARDHHAEAIELATVHDAYQLLTRTRLPAPVPLAEAEMALDPGTLPAVEAAYLAGQQRLAGEWAALLQLEQAGRLPATIRAMARLAKLRSEQAEALHRAGKLPAAHDRMLAAWMLAAGANGSYAVVARLQAGDVDGAVAALSAHGPGDLDVAALVARIAALPSASLGGQLATQAAREAALRGLSYQGFAAGAIRAATQLLGDLQGMAPAGLGAPATADTVASAVAPAVVATLRAIAESSRAELALSLAPAEGLPYPGSPPGLARIAAALEAVSAATLGYADALVVEPLARGAGLSTDQARRRVAAAEPDYLIASALAHAPPEGPPDAQTSPAAAAPPGATPEATPGATDAALAASLRALAGREVALHSAALLVARRDALAVHTDEAGKVDAVGHPESLRPLLANAARAARADARAARIATGAVPVQARLAYQLAAVDAAGNLEDQLGALAAFWASSAASRTAVLLARN